MSPSSRTFLTYGDLLLLLAVYLLVFQMWMVSGSVMLCCSACSSSKSKKYLTARGTGRLVLRIAVNKSSTNFCSVPWDRAEEDNKHVKQRSGGCFKGALCWFYTWQFVCENVFCGSGGTLSCYPDDVINIFGFKVYVVDCGVGFRNIGIYQAGSNIWHCPTAL